MLQSYQFAPTVEQALEVVTGPSLPPEDRPAVVGDVAIPVAVWCKVAPVRDQQAYWDREAGRKTFTHPLNRAWLDTFVPRTARVLDYGCGYGRSLAELASLGYSGMVGMDFSPAMVGRGRRSFPGLDLRVAETLPTDESDASFDAVLLLAVLTCIPGDREQEAVMGEVRRLLRPGGVLYISDMPLQADGRNLARYARDATRFGAYGVFETDDGALVRHHDGRRLEALLAGFDVVAAGSISISTMNGHAATGVQVLARTAAPGGRDNPVVTEVPRYPRLSRR